MVKKKTDVLKRINLKVKSGEKIGLVGESGAGKTTLINIISTLLNPSRGELLFNNNLLKNVEKSRPIRIGMVSQDVFLLNGTIIENIAFGVPEKLIDINKVKECINSSNLSRLIASLEKGIYSEVGERGVELSGGQRQRIGLARALYNNDDLLILDEATSALDGVTEKEVIDTIMEDASCTVVIIAHRIHTLKQCNKIYIMSSGEFIESGNYNELKEKSHHFRELGYLT